jgi:7-keto-8-aminopelargonate synthetase-like enzyme
MSSWLFSVTVRPAFGATPPRCSHGVFGCDLGCSRSPVPVSDFFQDQLDALRARSLDRHLHEISSGQGPEIEISGRRLINFSSNDYLGLANNPRLRDAAIAAISEFGVGAGASRLITGTQSPHLRLEQALAKWKGTEAALCFSSGYAAALGTVPALVTKNDVVLLDKLCHASLIDGARLSGAVLRVFPHNHLGKLESLMLDEAHAVGVIGANGRGLAAAENLNEDVDVQMGTLSKALGTSGGYICGSRNLIEWLINRARSFIYSTAPPPGIVAAALAAVDFLSSPEGEERRVLLWEKIDSMRDHLSLVTSHFSPRNVTPSSAVFPWIVGDEKAALDLASALRDQGFLVPAIRYPTVAKGAARLRFTVTASHSEHQIQLLCEAIKRNSL